MNKLMANLIILIIISAILGAGGQILLKKGVNEIGKINIKMNTLPLTIFKLLTNKFIFLGLLLFVIGSFAWIFALSGVNLSIGYPIASGLLYISIITLSIIFLKEKINFIQLVGIFITLTGVIILAKFGR